MKTVTDKNKFLPALILSLIIFVAGLSFQTVAAVSPENVDISEPGYNQVDEELQEYFDSEEYALLLANWNWGAEDADEYYSSQYAYMSDSDTELQEYFASAEYADLLANWDYTRDDVPEPSIFVTLDEEILLEEDYADDFLNIFGANYDEEEMGTEEADLIASLDEEEPFDADLSAALSEIDGGESTSVWWFVFGIILLVIVVILVRNLLKIKKKNIISKQESPKSSETLFENNNNPNNNNQHNINQNNQNQNNQNPQNK